MKGTLNDMIVHYIESSDPKLKVSFIANFKEEEPDLLAHCGERFCSRARFILIRWKPPFP